MTSPQPFPPENAQAPGGDDISQYAAMMGVQRQPNQLRSPQQGADALRRQQLDEASKQIEQLGKGLDVLAVQFPQVAKEVEELHRALNAILVRIVGSAMPGSTPTTGAMG